MIFLLCSGCRTIYWLYLIYLYLLYKHWRFYFNLVLLVLFINISKNLRFVFKSGCKGKGFYFNCQTFRKFFFVFLFRFVSQALLAKGKEGTKTINGKPRLFANRTANIRTLFIIIQTFLDLFVLKVKRSYALSLGQFCKAVLSWKAGAKVDTLYITSKYIQLFFWSILKEKR